MRSRPMCSYRCWVPREFGPAVADTAGELCDAAMTAPSFASALSETAGEVVSLMKEARASNITYVACTWEGADVARQCETR